MKREEILKLIEEEEAQDLVSKTRGEERVKRTEEIFHAIKQEVMGKVVKHCIRNSYAISSRDLSLLICEVLLESGVTGLTSENSKIISQGVEGFHRFVIREDIGECSSKKFFNYRSFFDDYLLHTSTTSLMERHGFEMGVGYFGYEYKITKEKLLSFSEIISKEFDSSYSGSTSNSALSNDSAVPNKTNPLKVEKEDDALVYQTVGVIVFFIVIFLWFLIFK